MSHDPADVDKIDDFEVKCIKCNKRPNEIGEYVSMAQQEREEGLSNEVRAMFGLPSIESGDYEPTAEQYVIYNEGTYNPTNGHFTCTNCYIEMGMPTRSGEGWRAP